MIKQEEFFAKYNISNETFKDTRLDWKLIEDVYATYKQSISELEPTLSL